MKFAVASDCHIRLLKFHSNYKVVFERFYELLRQKNPDVIVFAGDLVHSKTNLSPEMVETATSFLRSLSKIAPTYLIIGNHDTSTNLSRQDSISPLVDALNDSNIHLLRDSGVTPLNGQFNLCNLSIVDKQNWDMPLDLSKTNICLYHGPIIGATTDVGWVIDKSELSIEDLEDKYHFGFFGDLHKANQELDKAGRFRYSGSLIAQNFSEEEEKGFLFWDIQDKAQFTCEFIPVPNPCPFVTISIEEGTLPEDIKVPPGARIRLRMSEGLSYDVVRKLVDIAKVRFSAESVTFITDTTIKSSGVTFSSLTEGENLRDQSVQERLIREYFAGQGIDEDILEQVIVLNGKYKSLLEQDEDEVMRNVHWKVDTLEWDNLFNYGEGNKIDFSLLKGIVGVFGKSFLGKSSISESLCYTIFNAITKNSRKNYNIINQNKNRGCGRVQLDVGGNKFFVGRVSEKYERRLKGQTTDEAKTTVEFRRLGEIGESLNGLERSDTDKNIRRMFGTIDDFVLTTMASQFGSLNFIGEGSTKRKEILVKFLDLEIFDKRFKLAKEDAAELKASLKRMEGTDFDKLIEQARDNVLSSKTVLENREKELQVAKAGLLTVSENHETLSKRLLTVPTVSIDIKQVRWDYERLLQAVRIGRARNIELQDGLLEKQSVIGKIDKLLLEVFDVEDYRARRSQGEALLKELESITHSIQYCDKRVSDYGKRVKLLDMVPCGDQFSNCRFIKDAFEAKEALIIEKKACMELHNRKKEIEESLVELDLEKVKSCLDKYEQLCDKKSTVTTEIADLNRLIQQTTAQINEDIIRHTDLESQIYVYEGHRDIIENYEATLQEKKRLAGSLAMLQTSVEAGEQNLINLYKKIGSFEQQLADFTEKKEELEQLRKKYSAFEMYCSAMHVDGISYRIIQQKLPTINDEIAKILANVVPFNVFFECDGNRLDVKIKHAAFPARTLDMGSGAEKSIAALAIRIALIKVCSLPKPEFLILDEPATSFDEQTMDGFLKLLDVLKEYFSFVLLVSHIESLKDVVDSEIAINVVDKYARVVHTAD